MSADGLGNRNLAAVAAPIIREFFACQTAEGKFQYLAYDLLTMIEPMLYPVRYRAVTPRSISKISERLVS
jgi:hypothetical protein